MTKPDPIAILAAAATRVERECDMTPMQVALTMLQVAIVQSSGWLEPANVPTVLRGLADKYEERQPPMLN